MGTFSDRLSIFYFHTWHKIPGIKICTQSSKGFIGCSNFQSLQLKNTPKMMISDGKCTDYFFALRKGECVHVPVTLTSLVLFLRRSVAHTFVHSHKQEEEETRDIDHDDHSNSSTAAALTSPPPNHTHPSAESIPFRQPLAHLQTINKNTSAFMICVGNRRSEPSTSRSEPWTPPIGQNNHRPTPTNHQSILTMLSINCAETPDDFSSRSPADFVDTRAAIASNVLIRS
jgi:hypothetical protein